MTLESIALGMRESPVAHQYIAITSTFSVCVCVIEKSREAQVTKLFTNIVTGFQFSINQNLKKKYHWSSDQFPSVDSHET